MSYEESYLKKYYRYPEKIKLIQDTTSTFTFLIHPKTQKLIIQIKISSIQSTSFNVCLHVTMS